LNGMFGTAFSCQEVDFNPFDDNGIFMDPRRR